MLIADFRKMVDARRRRFPFEREGQAAFNVLYFERVSPQLADQIRGTSIDPFYDDQVLACFYDLVTEHLACN